MDRNVIQQALTENVVEVTFTKINGDERVMTCTLIPNILPAATKADTMSQKKVRELNEEVMSVWDINAKGWRSFRVANVTKWVVTEYGNGTEDGANY
jgi:hypothetical protein